MSHILTEKTTNNKQKLPTSHSSRPSEKVENFFRGASAADFKKIPGSPIAYWMSQLIFSLFDGQNLTSIALARIGIQSGDNERHYRAWNEVSFNSIHFDIKNISDTKMIHRGWFPLQHGGERRKWYGNNSFVVNLSNKAKAILKTKNASLRNSGSYFKASVVWNRISAGYFMARYIESGFAFDDVSPFVQPYATHDIGYLLALLNSFPIRRLLSIYNAGFKTEVGHIKSLPIPTSAIKTDVSIISEPLIQIGRLDWNSYEYSWDFTTLPLLQPNYRQPTLEATYTTIRAHWQSTTLEMQHLEEENNRIFIEAYGLQDELTPDVPLEEITLTCNPFYRYGKKVGSGEWEVGSDGEKSFPVDSDLEERLLADTMKEFISYAVGCMFGRYSLDAPGLILANQGEGVADYVRKVRSVKCEVESNTTTSHSPLPTSHCSASHLSGFEPDTDNVIPILDDNWFTDDIVDRFQCFLRVTFGDEHYEDNLKFIEKAIGKSVRKYFLKDFYKDHVKRYKKRPIYWLFSSPKGGFNALIYMHRYRPDTVSVILNDYLREFRTKLTARKEHLEKVSISATADNREKTAALKEVEKLTKTIDELNTYENDILYPLATQNIEIDLDDGVKTNYPKFGAALKKIPGVS